MDTNKPSDPVADALAKAALESSDPYTGDDFADGFAPKTGPGSEQFTPEKKYHRPLERNVCVGPLVVSACRCPSCGQVYAHFVNGEREGWYSGLGKPTEELDPPCLRCVLKLGAPLAPHEAGAMAEVRWRLDQYQAARAPGNPGGEKLERETCLRYYSTLERLGHVLLTALEERYGNQQDAGVAAIEQGLSGVVT